MPQPSFVQRPAWNYRQEATRAHGAGLQARSRCGSGARYIGGDQALQFFGPVVNDDRRALGLDHVLIAQRRRRACTRWECSTPAP